MLYGSVGDNWVNVSTDKPIHKLQQAELFQMIGMLDKDIDAKFAPIELSRQLKHFVGNRFAEFDKNTNDGLGMRELGGVFQAMSQARRGQTAKVTD